MIDAVVEKAVVNVACSEAKVAPIAGLPAYVTVPLIGVPAFRNCTVPLGAAALLLCVLTIAVSVTVEPDPTLVGAVTAVEVTACVMVIATGPVVLN